VSVSLALLGVRLSSFNYFCLRPTDAVSGRTVSYDKILYTFSALIDNGVLNNMQTRGGVVVAPVKKTINASSNYIFNFQTKCAYLKLIFILFTKCLLHVSALTVPSSCRKLEQRRNIYCHKTMKRYKKWLFSTVRYQHASDKSF